MDRPILIEVDDVWEGVNGVCLACGEVKYGGVEPDAHDYPCDECGESKVMGMEDAIMLGHATV